MQKILPLKKLVFFLFVFGCLFSGNALASHIRGGYITAKRISGYRYGFVLTIFRDIGSDVRNEINDIHPDINSTAVVSSAVSSVTAIPGKRTEIWVYNYEYTYTSPGIYTAYHYQLNRNANVLNMTNSDQTTFYVETKVIIDPFLAADQTPVITKAAIDEAVVGSVYRYNPGAYDPNGDSLSYEHVPSRQFITGTNVSAVVNNYQNPAVRSGGRDSSNLEGRPATMILNPVTGDLVWNVPRIVGQFNTAIKIVQWRKIRESRNRKDSIGYTLLDIQIIVEDSRNKRPILQLPRDTCVVAGSKLEARIYATDPDAGDKVKITFEGELDTLLPASQRATFINSSSTVRPFFGDFEWQTRCTHVRRQPYSALFTAEDIPVFPPSLVDVRVWRIKVVGPPPRLKSVNRESNGVLLLKWEPYTCANASKIFIYRKIDSTDIQLDTCNPGMPADAGYVKIGERAITDTTFLDNNDGKGLKKGPNYCYRLVAVFPEPAGGESLVSNEICQSLRLDIPVLTQVSVASTSQNQGTIQIKWTTPFFIDTNLYKPPYTVQLHRFEGSLPGVLVKSTTDTTDTTFVDKQLNTESKLYRYQIKFLFGSLENLVDSTPKASAVRLELKPGIRKITLQWSANVPWSNDGFYHYIYRKTNGSFILIDSILASGGNYTYTDDGKFGGVPLSDTTLYCYYVDTRGSYSNPLIASPLVNLSQENCSSPTDTVRPCPPPTIVIQDPLDFFCDSCALLRTQTEFSRIIKWKDISVDSCADDLASYRVYYSEYEEDPLQPIGVTVDTFFIHTPLTNLAGCYAVSALDRSGNESFLINRTCVDNCIRFNLPNLITPNYDLKNDLFTPLCISRAFVRNMKVTIYNRWGKKVFEDETSPEINWGGYSERTSTTVVPGVYFYLIEVEFKRLSRSNERMKYKGWVEVSK